MNDVVLLMGLLDPCHPAGRQSGPLTKMGRWLAGRAEHGAQAELPPLARHAAGDDPGGTVIASALSAAR